MVYGSSDEYPGESEERAERSERDPRPDEQREMARDAAIDCLTKGKMFEVVVAEEDGNRAARCPLVHFITDNIDDTELCVRVCSLKPGEAMMAGGGAAPLLRITRVETEDERNANVLRKLGGAP